MSSAARERFDVVVIGGGPSGSLFTSLVRRQDPERRVLLLEKEAMPRYHVGESFIPGIAPILSRAGVLEEMERVADGPNEIGLVRKAGIVFNWGAVERGSWSADFREPDSGKAAPGSYHADRGKLDRFLLDHARRAGADVREGATVEAIERLDPAGFRVRFRREGATQEIDADWLVDASGLTRLLCREWGIARRGFDHMNNYAVHGYWRGSRRHQHGAPLRDWEAWTFISTAPDGWCWHIPLGVGDDALVSVGLVTSKDAIPSGGPEALEEFYLRNVRATWGTSDLLADATFDRHPLAPARIMVVRDWSSRAERFCGPGWFVIGDAAAFVDPILTTGFVLCSIGASLAASALHTIWNGRDVDEDLLRASYEETYTDIVAGYHRLAMIWYRRNDKVRSWWWEARRGALRSTGAPNETTDMRAFLSLSLGLARDPFAGRANERGQTVDLVRPDKVLFAHHLFEEARVVEDEVAKVLGQLTEDHLGEIEARGVLYAALIARWRALLDQAPVLADVEIRKRDRYYTDRTMPFWRRETFVECVLRGGDPHVDKIVLPGDTDPAAPLGVTLAPGETLRASLLRACAVLGAHQAGAFLRHVRDRVLQLDFRGWLRTDAGMDHSPRGNDPSSPDLAAERDLLLAFVRRISGERRVGIEVDLLGRAVEIAFGEPGVARLQLAPIAAGERRAWQSTATAYASYLGRDLDEASRATHGGVLDALRALETHAPADVGAVWRALGRLEGFCAILTPDRHVPAMPEELHPESLARRTLIQK